MSRIPQIIVVGVSTDPAAVQEFLAKAQSLTFASIFFVQKVESQEKALTPEFLQQHSGLPAQWAENQGPIETGTIYLIKNDGIATFESENEIHYRPCRNHEEKLSIIDLFFASAAETFEGGTIGVLLAGAGVDGSQGLRMIGDVGGLTILQELDQPSPSLAAYMLSLEFADRVVPIQQIADEIAAYVEFVRDDGDRSKTDIENSLDTICEILKAQTQHDFKHYKSSTLVRRIQRRIQVLRARSVQGYIDFLRGDQAEIDYLFKELLINVTSFFRDPQSFEVLRERAIESILNNMPFPDRIRVWVAGCSTGEEAYTLAILFAESLEKRGSAANFQIIATDIDEHALAIARKGTYSLAIAAVISEKRLEKYFVRKGNKYTIRKEIRELCLFSAHNLVNDPPFSQIDLISCRNVLIYFGSHLQQKLIPIFHYALRDNGFLFLGNSESVSGHGELFKTVSAKDRIAQKKATGIRSSREYPLSFRASYLPHPGEQATMKEADIHLVGQRILLDEFAPRYAIVSEDLSIVSLSEGMALYLTHPVGVYEGTLSKLIRPELRVALRSSFREAQREKRKITHAGSTFRKGEEVQRVRVTVQPMPQLGTDDGLYMIVFTDLGLVNDSEKPASEDEGRIEFSVVEQLEKELAHVKGDLDRTVQDLEASNEELKSSNEELLSMNEELQSANEELEASKEEVQLANDNLRRSNTDLENLLSSTQIATLFLEEDLRIKSFTPAVAEIYYILPCDIGRSILHLAHQASYMPPLPRSLANFEEGVPDTEVIMPNGRIFLRRILPYKTEGNQTDGMVVTFTDVTELRQSEGMFEAISNALPAMNWTADASGRAEFFNSNWLEFTGKSEAESMGMGWMTMVDPEQVLQLSSIFQQAVLDQERIQIELRIKNRHDEFIWHSVSIIPVQLATNVVVRWIISAIDIHQAKSLQLSTSANELFFRQFTNLVPQMLWRADNEGRITFLSQRWLDYVGPTQGLRINLPHIHPDDRELFALQWRRSVETGEDFELEYRIRGHDGIYRWFVDRAKRIQTSDGVWEWIGAAADMDMRKKDEIEQSSRLTKDKNDADAANRLKSMFLANMSHEIRTPLGAIIGYSELLSEKLYDNPPLQMDVDRIQSNAQHLGELIDDILDLSKVEADRLELDKHAFNPRATLQDVFGVLELKARQKGVVLEERWVGRVPPLIYTDSKRFRQILLNVIGNAVKFTDRGSVSVELSLIKWKESDFLQIDITDTGIGLTKESIEKIFVPFSQADGSITRRYGGTGLGLGLAARFAEALGGSLVVLRSELNVGTTFRLLVEIGPLPEPKIHEIEERYPIVPNLNRLKGMKVLVVEDSSDNVIIVSRYLKFEGAEVSIARDGVEALEALEGEAFDLVLMDLQMPRMDGYTALEVLRSKGYEGPVVALTAHAMKEEKKRAFEAGFNDYLVKPINRARLVDCALTLCLKNQTR